MVYGVKHIYINIPSYIVTWVPCWLYIQRHRGEAKDKFGGRERIEGKKIAPLRTMENKAIIGKIKC